MNAITSTHATGNGKKKRHRGKWGSSRMKRMIEWGHPLLGTIQVQVEEFDIGEVQQKGPDTWVRISVPANKRPSKIEIDFGTTLEKDVILLRSSLLDQMVDYTNDALPPFQVAVTWQPGKRPGSDPIPHTRKTGKDNFDLFYIRKEDGIFVRLAISIVTRRGAFWLTVQEILGGQITTRDGKTTIVPAYSENCYPKADHLKSMGQMGIELIDFAKKLGVQAPADAKPEEWEPRWPSEIPENLRRLGYKTAVIQWFNLTIGYGFAWLEDERPCFVHFNAIQDAEGKPLPAWEFPVLEASAGVFIKTKEENGKLKATAVRLA